MDLEIGKRLTALEMRLDLEFKNRALLLEAVTHRSYLNEHPDHPVGHNELLEFLGDAALEIVVTEFLFRKHRDKSEGLLTNMRANLVNGETLAQIAETLDLMNFMFLSRGEQRDSVAGSKSRMWIMANAFEALVGAIYADQGLAGVRFFADAHVLSRSSSIMNSCRDYKSELQETTQALFKITPVYRVLEQSGSDHEANFLIGVYFHSKLIAKANGSSKKDAQKAAAQAALELRNQWAQLMKGGVR